GGGGGVSYSLWLGVPPGSISGVAGPIEQWEVEEGRRYLGEKIPAGRLGDYPRGGALAHLFAVVGAGGDPRPPQRPNLLVTRQFFDRYTDSGALKDALESAEVGRSLTRAGDRTVELY